MSKENNEGVIDLFGKKYHTVGKRIADLGEQTSKDYTLITNYDITQYPVVIIKAVLTVGTNSYSGHAMGDISDQSLRSKVKGKVLESTETHAIGRALAAYGSNGGEFASADEMLQNSNSSYDNPKPKLDVNDDYIPFKKGKNKGKSLVELDEGSLEWIVHESGMAQEVKDYADKVLGEKYVNIDGESHNNIVNQTIEQEVDTPDNEAIPF
tara:strand:+ start:778 stop:1407 length:630 start_codon:yes stop_codon:yes gene_type:complete